MQEVGSRLVTSNMHEHNYFSHDISRVNIPILLPMAFLTFAEAKQEEQRQELETGTKLKALPPYGRGLICVLSARGSASNMLRQIAWYYSDLNI